MAGASRFDKKTAVFVGTLANPIEDSHPLRHTPILLFQSFSCAEWVLACNASHFRSDVRIIDARKQGSSDAFIRVDGHVGAVGVHHAIGVRTDAGSCGARTFLQA
jgi:hypothetical protein